MGLSSEQRERLREIAAEAKQIIGGCLHPDGRPMTFAELEDECIEVGDLLSSAMLQQRMTEREPLERPPDCPSKRMAGRRERNRPRSLA